MHSKISFVPASLPANGIYEGRDPRADIDVSCYAGRYSDVRNAYGLVIGAKAGNPYRLVARHLFMFADDDGREYTHDASVLVTPVPCGQVGTEVWGCACGEAESYVTKEITEPRPHNMQVRWEWDVKVKDNAPALDTYTAKATLYCANNCGNVEDVTRTATITKKDEVEASCTVDGHVTLEAKVNFSGTVYTDTYEVNLPAAHTIRYEFGKVNPSNDKEVIFETANINSVTTTKKDGYHRQVCDKCGLRLTDWEKHSYTEYVNSEEAPNMFVAKCDCGLSYTNSVESAKNLRNVLQDGFSTCGATVVRIAYPFWQQDGLAEPGIHMHNEGTQSGNLGTTTSESYITIPKNVTLVVEKPEYLIWDRTETPITFKLEEGASIEGQLSENIIVISANSDTVKTTVTKPAALTAAVSAATTNNMNLDLTLDEDIKDVTSAMVVGDGTHKVNVTIDLGGNTIEATGASVNDLFQVKKGSTLTLRNGKIEDKGTGDKECAIDVKGGDVVLDNVEIESTHYGIWLGDAQPAKAGGTFTMTGGSITVSGNDGFCVSTSNDKSEKATVVLDGVTLNAPNSTAVYLPAEDCTTTIRNCAITAKAGVEIASGSLVMENTTIEYTTKLADKHESLVGGKALGEGALFVKLVSPYISANDKVSVTLSSVTMTYKGSDTDAKPVGIFIDTNMSREKNFVGEGYEFSSLDKAHIYDKNVTAE